MSLVISIPTVEMSEPSPCGGDMLPRPLPSREDILREMERRITATYEVMRDIKTKIDELVVHLLWDAFSSPYCLDAAARQSFLQSKPEYVSTKAALDSAVAVFHDAIAMRDRFMST